MDLILWRHAEAEDGMPDDARRLTAKGEKQAARMAQWLRARLPNHALVLVSPTQRARQTAQALTDNFKVTAALGTGADVKSLLKAANWPDAKEAVVLVGHQPTLGQTAAWLLAGTEAEWAIKKSGVWWLRRRDEETVLCAAMSPELL